MALHQRSVDDLVLMLGPLLIANRGEIAVRIIRTARGLGLRTIAVYSDPDTDALWTRTADETVPIGPAMAYLDSDRLIAAARASGAVAVHPGYGMLSEDADFARAVRAAGLVFVGPRSETIEVMGDKLRARASAIACGVPVLPGSGCLPGDLAAAARIADRIGWPLLVKAAGGGGGRGIRIAASPADLAVALADSARESQALFGRAELFLERYLPRARHVEVQLLGDAHGGLVHLHDRDCSLQRRQQKLIEEAPAPALPALLRANILAAAVKLGREVGYEGAGTAEFLVDVEREAFFFLEMNTRLQVEHGVTELITGIDLVEWQLRIADGQPLAFDQSAVRMSGHAIQARIASENPYADFAPAPGRLTALRLPQGPWLRCDFGAETGFELSPFYDSMFGKVMAWGNDREASRRRLAGALDELIVGGVPTTAPYLRAILDEPDFQACTHHIGSIENDFRPSLRPHSRAEASAPGPVNAGARLVHLPWGDKRVRFVIDLAPDSHLTETSRTSPDRNVPSVGAQPEDSVQRIIAPIDGAVADVLVSAGSQVAQGDRLVVLEAMKMLLPLFAPASAKILTVHVAIGDAVRIGAPLLTFEVDPFPREPTGQ